MTPETLVTDALVEAFVIEGGRRLIGSRVDVEVTRVLPTAGGRLVFCRLRQPVPLRPEGDGTSNGEPAPSTRDRLRVVRDSSPPDAT